MYETQDDHEPRALAIVTPRVNLDKQQLIVLKQTIAPNLTGPELAFFGNVCQRMQLDPFARQIYAIKRGTGDDAKLTIQVGIDGFRALAERTGLYRGQLGPFWCGPDGEWRDAWLSDTAPVAAKVGVIRADFREPVWAVARTKAYQQDKSPLWSKMPETMIAKCAEALALRKAFPDSLSGAYEPGEMDQAGASVHADIVDEASYAERVTVAPESVMTRTATVTAAQWDALKERMRSECKLTTLPLASTFMQASIGRDLAGELPTLAEYDKLIASVNRAAAALRKTARTARPATPAPSADEMAAGQADYDASVSADDFPPADNDIDLSKLPMGAMPS